VSGVEVVGDGDLVLRMETPEPNVAISTREEARARADEIREHLLLGFGKLALAREKRDDVALGYPSWWLYVETEFGALRELGLPASEREHVVESMSRDGLSQHVIAERLSVSPGTVNSDLKRRGVQTDVVRGKDGKLYPSRKAPKETPTAFARLPGMSKRAEVVARVRAAGEAGMTCHEIEKATGWHHGVASSPFSAVAGQHKILPTGEKREGYRVYVVPEFAVVEGEVVTP
jgi:transposase